MTEVAVRLGVLPHYCLTVYNRRVHMGHTCGWSASSIDEKATETYRGFVGGRPSKKR